MADERYPVRLLTVRAAVTDNHRLLTTLQIPVKISVVITVMNSSWAHARVRASGYVLLSGPSSLFRTISRSSA